MASSVLALEIPSEALINRSADSESAVIPLPKSVGPCNREIIQLFQGLNSNNELICFVKKKTKQANLGLDNSSPFVLLA